MVRKLAAVAAVCCGLASVVTTAPGAVASGLDSTAHHLKLPVDRDVAGQLKVITRDSDPARAGEVATIRALVVNGGSDRSTAFTVVVTLPEGTTAEGPFFPENCEAEGLTVTCHYRKGLPAGHTASAIVPVRIAADATGVLNGGSVRVSEDTAPEAADTGYFDVPVADAVLTE
ncbi:hypothetical protein ACIRPK_35080 [Kitasatospora sp. NPDC101801]|uniref:hypothetical protein n=1 Tax=Kitasatospora sp. NPDC101801 TaxID=3364103 RepID=UPI0037FE119F